MNNKNEIEPSVSTSTNNQNKIDRFAKISEKISQISQTEIQKILKNLRK